jgi:hypothetical protein
VGWSIFTKVLLQVVMEEVPRSRCAILIILIFINGEKVPNNHNFWGAFSFSEKKLTKLVNFITKKTVTIYPPSLYFFLGIVLVGMGIGNKFMALKRAPSNKILPTLNEWAQHPSSF